ncbi:MAG: S-methyl-5'-thioadenosine phosphorylase [Candidatus Aminicenantales bacterium]
MSVKKEEKAEVGILGGTGLYEIEGLEKIEEISLETPFGAPSDVYVRGELEGRSVAFLNRHGKGHRILPSEINYRANIYGFKMLGVERIISVNSVGSLKEEIKPRDIVLADQFIDRTKRESSFFGRGIAAHVSFAQPVCPALSELVYRAGTQLELRVKKGGTYICIDGPAFSTRAESLLYRSWGCDVIGMTSATEAKLSREAEICYATINLVCDFDAWHEEEEAVSVEMILEAMRENIHNAKAIIRKAVADIPAERGDECGCGSALENVIVTGPKIIPDEAKKRLKLILEKYIKT